MRRVASNKHKKTIRFFISLPYSCFFSLFIKGKLTLHVISCKVFLISSNTLSRSPNTL